MLQCNNKDRASTREFIQKQATRVKFEGTKYGTSSCALRGAESASSCNRFAPKAADAASVGKIGPRGAHQWRKGKAESNFHPSLGHLHV